MTKPRAYYNEIDEHAADWLENLIEARLIADGDVDRRDIRDVTPSDLASYTQCHFFAGVGVWSYALRLAGWPDERPVWTGSCPCQPFSAAGKRSGTSDERHLWPAWDWLIAQRAPERIFGEQVASPDGLGWLDLVCSDLEGKGYAVGSPDSCAAGVGAPHIRQRLRFVADATSARSIGPISPSEGKARHEARLLVSGEIVAVGGMADTDESERGRRSSDGRSKRDWPHARRAQDQCNSAGSRKIGELEYAARDGWNERRPQSGGGGIASGRGDVRPGPTNGFWRDADWIACRDGKWRPVEPGTFPLVDGAAFRLGSGSAFEGKSRAKMLRGYGNAIVAPDMAEFIRATMEYRP